MRNLEKLIIASLICSAVAANLLLMVAWPPIALLIPLAALGSLKLDGQKRLFAFCSIIVLGTAVLLSLKNPYGGWDAKTFWNLKALSFYAGDWQSSTDNIDHPLLIPAVIAVIWKLLGTPTPTVPISIAIAFGIGVVASVVYIVKHARTTKAGLLAGLLVLSAPTFVIQTSSQYADVPLAFFILLTLLFSVRNNYTVAGLFAGLAAWTKNEGLLFVFTIIIATVVANRSLKQAARITLGALPMLAAVVWFKLFMAPSNSVLTSENITDRLVDPSRYLTILLAFVTEALNVFNWGAALLALALLPILGIAVQPRLRLQVTTGVIAIGLMLAGYFMIYVITPFELKMHLATSLNRLFMQLMPIAVVLLFLGAKLPKDSPINPHLSSDVQVATETGATTD